MRLNFTQKAMRESMGASVLPRLAPEERLQVVILAQKVGLAPAFSMLGVFAGAMVAGGLNSEILCLLVGMVGLPVLIWAFATSTGYRIIAATDWRLLVFDAGRWNPTAARGLIAELDRRTLINVPAPLVAGRVKLGPERLMINYRFRRDVELANYAALNPEGFRMANLVPPWQPRTTGWGQNWK